MHSALRTLLLLLVGFLLGACGPTPHSASSKPAPGAQALSPGAVPEQARSVLAHVKAYGEAPAGIQGGRRFGNYEHRLPERDVQGRSLHYQEWDVWPKVGGRNRGAERLVTGSDGRAWYTGDHYRTFTEVRP